MAFATMPYKFQRSLFQLHDPISAAHYYTIVGKDSSRWQHVIPKFGLYAMTDKHFQSSLARRYHLPQATTFLYMPLRLPPLIDPESRHYTTGCPLRGVRQASSTSLINALLYILYYAG